MPHGVWLHLSEMSRTGKSTGIKSKYVDPKGLEVKEKEGDKIFYCNDFFTLWICEKPPTCMHLIVYELDLNTTMR